MKVSIPYLAGYILADGHIERNAVRLHSVDKSLLLNIVDKVSERTFNVQGKEYKAWTGYLNVSDMPFHIFDSKDYRDYYYSLSEEDRDKFVHGYIDGDGSICYYSDKRHLGIFIYIVKDIETEIIKSWLKSRNIERICDTVDNRGVAVRQLAITNLSDCVKILSLIFSEGVFLKRKFIPVLRFIVDIGRIHKMDDFVAGFSVIRGFIGKDTSLVLKDVAGVKSGVYVGNWSISKEFWRGVIFAASYRRSGGVAFSVSKMRDYSLLDSLIKWVKKGNMGIIPYDFIKSLGLLDEQLPEDVVLRIKSLV